MITANITRSSTIRLNCGLVVLPLGLFLVCSPSSWRISQSFDFPPRNDLVRLRRIFVFPNVTRTFLCSRPRNSIKYERALFASSFQIKLGPAPNAMCSPQTVGISQNRKTQKCQYDRTWNCFNVHRAINRDWKATRITCGRYRVLVCAFKRLFLRLCEMFLKICDYPPLNHLRVLHESWLPLISLAYSFVLFDTIRERAESCALYHTLRNIVEHSN